jgi:MerR family mercuric resistance operon transcriptional regulator
MPDRKLTISVVAKRASVGVETIRYYQRIGLIEEPDKPISGYRIYSEEAIARLSFIQRAKQLGFTLSEISSLLGLGDGKCEETKELANKKLESINLKIKDLRSMAHVLEQLIESCADNPAHQGCPIIRTISGG